MKRAKKYSSDSSNSSDLDSDESFCSQSGYPDDIPEQDRDAILRRSRNGPPECTMHDYDIIGTLDYGIGMHYRELNEIADEPPTYGNNGLYFLRACGALPFISVSKAWMVVDSLSEDYHLVKRKAGFTAFLCEGTVPCVSSTTENTPAPYGKWWHGQTFTMQRIIRRDHEELLHILRDVPGAEHIGIFLVASTVPLRLIDLTKPK